jgi:hypothetical protein
MFGNKAYDFLKFLAQIFLPALATLYFGLSSIWNFPDSTKIIGTLTAIDAFLGVLLSISSTSYNNSEGKYDGDLNITDVGSRKALSVELNSHPEILAGKTEVTFKVNPRPKPYK